MKNSNKPSRASEPEAKRKRYSMRNVVQLKKIAPKRSWVVEGLLQEGAVALLAGHPKHGKGYMAKQLAASLATGEAFLGEFAVPEKGKTLYLDVNQAAGEEFADLLASALDRRKQFFGDILVPSLLAAERRGGFQIDFVRFPGEEAEADLREKIEAIRPRLVVIDDFETMRRDPPPDSTAYRYDKAVLRGIRKIAQDTGVAILIVLHVRKAKSESTSPSFQDFSGTAALRGEADINLLLWDGGKAAKPKPGLLRVEGRGVEPLTRKMGRHAPGTKFSGFWTILPDAVGPGVVSIDSGKLSPRLQDILSVLAKGERDYREIADALDISAGNAKSYLSVLKRQGKAENPRRGIWRLAGAE